jgi:uncharacterized protein with LGFP repeats
MGRVRTPVLGSLTAAALLTVAGALVADHLTTLTTPSPPLAGEPVVTADPATGPRLAPGERPVRTTEVPLAGRLSRTAGGPPTSAALRGRFSQVAVTWHGPTAPEVEVRTRRDGRWSAWLELEPLEDLDATEGDGTRGSDLVWVGVSDAVRVRTRGRTPRDLSLVLIDPGSLRSDRAPGSAARRSAPQAALALAAYQGESAEQSDTSSSSTSSTTGATDGPSDSTSASTSASASASASSPAVALTTAVPAPTPTYPLTSPPPLIEPAHHAPRPRIYGRQIWGADESWRRDIPYYSDTIVQAHVHHTASANGYTRAAVPGIIRGMYSYHTRTLGWNDLGYNFLIDRFGRVWEGRAGGIRAPVRGAHTLGFNDKSVGIAVIGNHQRARPSTYAVTALVRTIAWKLDLYGRAPGRMTTVVSEGSDRYPAGTPVWLPVTDGHRDTNLTACPGGYLYAKLPAIRRRAQYRATIY